MNRLAREAKAALDEGHRTEALRKGRQLRIENDALISELRAVTERWTKRILVTGEESAIKRVLRRCPQAERGSASRR